jgi:hypothetical protein
MLVAIKDTSSNTQIVLDGSNLGILPLTGEEATTFDFTNYPLFLAVTGFIIFVGAGGLVYLVFRKDKVGGKKRRIARITTMFGVLFLAGGVLLISYAIGNNTDEVVDIKATTIDVAQTPTFSLSPTPTVALTVH